MKRLIGLGVVAFAVACGETAPAPAAQSEAAMTTCRGTYDVDALIANAAKGGPELGAVFRCLSANDQQTVLESDLPIEETTIEPTGELEKRLMKEVESAARVWWDTVLEGPYSLEGDAEISYVDELSLGGKRLALRLAFGAPAVMTESCETNENANANRAGWPEDCTRGTISQTIYLDEDFEPIEGMEEYADFSD